MKRSNHRKRRWHPYNVGSGIGWRHARCRTSDPRRSPRSPGGDDLQPSIADYGFISDCHSAALVARAGSIDCWCACRARLSTGALTLRRVRQLVGDVVAVRQGEGDTNLHLVDGLALFGPDDVGDLHDDLHPNADGYRRIGERFHDLVSADGGPFSHR